MGPHVVPQKSFCCKSFGAVRALEPLTYNTHRVKRFSHLLPAFALPDVTFHSALSDDVVKEFGVVGVHAPAAWTRHDLLLSVAAQVLPQLGATFSCRFTI